MDLDYTPEAPGAKELKTYQRIAQVASSKMLKMRSAMKLSDGRAISIM